MVRANEAVIQEVDGVDRFAKRLEVLKTDLQAKEAELEAKLSKYRTKEDIKQVWPSVVQAARLHADSTIAKEMLSNLLKGLGFGSL